MTDEDVKFLANFPLSLASLTCFNPAKSLFCTAMKLSYFFLSASRIFRLFLPFSF
jgi:hypothetical protein